MKISKVCEVCGAEFVASYMTRKYCSGSCARVAYRKRMSEEKLKEQESADLIRKEEAIRSLREKAFLTPEDVRVLFGVSRATVYRYFQTGALKAVKIINKTFVRMSDIDKMFNDTSIYKKRHYQRREEQEYYTLREIMEKYNIGRKAVWGRCDRLGIPKVYKGRNTFFSKRAVDTKFSDLLDEIDLDNYYTITQVMDKYGMSKAGVLSFVKYHQVPRVNRNRKAYYSKVHIDSIKRKGDDVDPNWYSYEEVMQKYGLTKDQVSYTLKSYDIKTEKRGKFTMISRTDFDKNILQRMKGHITTEEVEEIEEITSKPIQPEKVCPPTPEGYYSTEEVALMFKISTRHVGVITRENDTPKITMKCFNFYEKSAIDLLFNQKNEYADITDWITPEEVCDTYKMSAYAVRSFIHRHKIPSKIEYGTTFYSKQHIDLVKNGNFEGKDRYYSVKDAMKKHNLSKDNVFYYINHYKITKRMNGKFVFFRKEEFDRLIKKHRSKDDLMTNIDD